MKHSFIPKVVYNPKPKRNFPWLKSGPIGRMMYPFTCAICGLDKDDDAHYIDLTLENCKIRIFNGGRLK